jgi:hypothetical protein
VGPRGKYNNNNSNNKNFFLPKTINLINQFNQWRLATKRASNDKETHTRQILPIETCQVRRKNTLPRESTNRKLTRKLLLSLRLSP